LATEADNGFALLVIRLQLHDAAGRMVDQAEGETSARLTPGLMNSIQGYGGLSRSAQPADDTQFATGDHGLLDDDLCGSREAREQQWDSHQRTPEHSFLPAFKAELPLPLLLRQFTGRCRSANQVRTKKPPTRGRLSSS
jgi:hypothetical protein